MRRWRCFVYLPIGLLAGLMLLLLGTLHWLDSAAGNRWLMQQINQAAGEQCRIKGLRGSPLYWLAADSIELTSGGRTVVVQHAIVRWNPWALLRHEVLLHKVYIGSIRIQGTAETSDNSTVALADVRLRLDDGEVGTLQWDDTELRSIRTQALRAGRNIASGQFELHYDGAFYQATVQGKPAAWQAQIRNDHGLKAGLSGSLLLRGGIDLAYNDADADRGLHIEGEWQHQEPLWTLAGQGRYHEQATALQGKLTVRYHGEALPQQVQLAATLDGSVQAPPASGIPRLPLKLSAHINAADASTTVYGTLRQPGLLADWAWQSQQGFNAALHFQSWHVPQTPATAKIPVVLSGEGELRWADALHVRANLPQCRIADQSLALRLDVQTDDLQTLIIHDLYAEQHDLRLHAKGRFNAASVDLYGEATASHLQPQLQKLQINGDARFQGRWSLRGAWPKARLQWDLEQASIHNLADVNASGLRTHGWLQVDGRQGSINASVPQLDYQQQHFRNLMLDAKLDGDHLRLGSSGDGDYRWTLDAAAEHDDHANWHGLLHRLELADSRPLLRLSDFAWQWQQGRLHTPKQAIVLLQQPLMLSFEGDERDGTMELELTQLPLEHFNPQLADAGIEFQHGEADATLLLHGPWQQPTLHLQAASTPITLHHQHSEAFATLELGQAKVQLDYAAGALNWQFSLGLPASGELQSRGSWLLQWQLYPYRLQVQAGEHGSVAMSMPDFSLLQPWLPGIAPLQGSWRINGSARHPAEQAWMMQGDIAAELRSIGVAKLGLDLYGHSHSQWRVVPPQDDQDHWRFSLENELQLFDGTGSLLLQLPVEYQQELTTSKAGNLRFHHFALVQLAEQQMRISGALSNRMIDGAMRIEGAVKADQLNIIIPPKHPEVTTDLQWQQGEKQTTSEDSPTLASIGLDVTADVGNHARISGKGIKLTLAGALHLHGTLAKPELSGTLSIPSGTVQQGSMVAEVMPDSIVTFTGDMNQPLLDVRLGRKVAKVLAGVRITGTASAPRTTLYSDPAMSDAEILSLLATGRPLAALGQGSVGDALLLASLLFSSEGDGVVDKLQQQFTRTLGLDTLDVESDGAGGSRLVAGTTLGKNTTLRVEEGLSTQGSTAISIEHSLSTGVTLFARQILHAAPLFGIRYVKSWYGKPLALTTAAADPSEPAHRR